MELTNNQIIVIGGGLSGLSAAHTILQAGINVLLLERNAFCGGNSTKATSGINGALTRVQEENKVPDSVAAFLKDTALSASKGQSTEPHALARVLVENSAPSVHWLIDKFGLDLSILGRLGGSSFPRTHRGGKRFPGMEITYALMKAYESACKNNKAPVAKLLTRSRAVSLIRDSENKVCGVIYEKKDKSRVKEYGPVIICTGGFGADFSSKGILASVRPDLLHLPTTNGSHCSGDGIKIAKDVGAGCVDLEHVQVHPTGLINPKEPNAKTLYLAAEALRGCGALLLDGSGKRFCDELGRRDYVSGEIFKRQGPFRLVLNSRASKEIEWHCKHYSGRGLMQKFDNGSSLAEEIGISPQELKKTFDEYNQCARENKDPFGKKFFANTPFELNDYFYVAQITPVIHYCMGGLAVNVHSAVLNENKQPIPGLFASGEVLGGVHGKNRLGGSSLLDCVVFGRIAGKTAAKYFNGLKKTRDENGKSQTNSKRNCWNLELMVNGAQINISIPFSVSKNKIEENKVSNLEKEEKSNSKEKNSEEKKSEKNLETNSKENSSQRLISMEEVSKHNTENDCWVVVNGVVLNVTKFLHDHPGGKKVILIYAGRDATEEFNMVHEKDVVEKYAPYTIIGKLDTSKTSSHIKAKL